MICVLVCIDVFVYAGCYVDIVFVCCRYSSMSEADKAIAFSLWQKKWNQFIDQTLDTSLN